jgi:zinc/manganese transport system substrate-binding protein
MTRADPARRAHFRAGVARTLADLRPLLRAVQTLRGRFAGAPVAYTERVPGLLLDAAGLRVLTPPSFARAVENGSETAPADVAAMQRLLTSRAVRVLLYNRQASTPLTLELRDTARSAGIPVVPVTETEPAGKSFVAWQLGQVRSLATALAR